MLLQGYFVVFKIKLN